MTRTAAIAAMGLVTSVVGTLVAALPTAGDVDIDFSKLLPVMIATLAASAAIITALATFFRFRESQEETSKAEVVSRYVGFERDVANAITASGGRPETGASDSGYDFGVTGQVLFLV